MERCPHCGGQALGCVGSTLTTRAVSRGLENGRVTRTASVSDFCQRRPLLSRPQPSLCRMRLERGSATLGAGDAQGRRYGALTKEPGMRTERNRKPSVYASEAIVGSNWRAAPII